jgi:hypothetical protein
MRPHAKGDGRTNAIVAALVSIWQATRLVLREALQLSRDASQILGEVVLTEDGPGASADRRPGHCSALAADSLAGQRGINDASRQGRYHNRRFTTIAEEVGLDVSPGSPIRLVLHDGPTAPAARYEEALTVLERALSGLPDRVTFSGTPGTVTTIACGCGHRIQHAHGVRAGGGAVHGLREVPVGTARRALMLLLVATSRARAARDLEPCVCGRAGIHRHGRAEPSAPVPGRLPSARSSEAFV